MVYTPVPDEVLQELLQPSNSKIVLLVMDGLGGMPLGPAGPTELEYAHTVNMDTLAADGVLGLHVPLAPGLAPGSGPAHLALFGYDAFRYRIGRGALAAAGVGLDLQPGDVVARGNFATLDDAGRILDRRAGRIPTKEAAPLVEKLARIRIPGVQIDVRPVRDYRFVLRLRGEGLSHKLKDTDPQRVGVPPFPVEPAEPTPEAQRTAEILNRWIEEARKALAGHPKANGVLLRGFATDPQLPKFGERYGLRAAAVAEYPMYRGVARLVGMDVLNLVDTTPEGLFQTVAQHWQTYDFFFVHFKETDSRGEDGDFFAKAQAIEKVDRALPILMDLKPDVVVITGDHSTPSRWRAHSWHPVPVLLWAPDSVRTDDQYRFGENACQHGGLGTFPAVHLMPLILAHAGRLKKYGA